MNIRIIIVGLLVLGILGFVIFQQLNDSPKTDTGSGSVNGANTGTGNDTGTGNSTGSGASTGTGSGTGTGTGSGTGTGTGSGTGTGIGTGTGATLPNPPAGTYVGSTSAASLTPIYTTTMVINSSGNITQGESRYPSTIGGITYTSADLSSMSGTFVAGICSMSAVSNVAGYITDITLTGTYDAVTHQITIHRPQYPAITRNVFKTA